VVIARPFNHAGPRQSHAFVMSSFARQIALAEAGLGETALHVGNLDARRDVTDVRDVVEAYEHLMESAPSGQAFNIASGQARRMGDLLDHLLRSAKVPIRVVVDEQRMRPNDNLVVVGDATRLRSALAWAPRIPIEQTLDDTLAWWRAEVARTS